MESFIVRSQPLRESQCRVSQRDAQILRQAINDGLRSIEQEYVRSFPPDAYFAYMDALGKWHWVTNAEIDIEAEYRLRRENGLVSFWNESVYTVDLVKAYDSVLYQQWVDAKANEIVENENVNIVFLLGDTSNGPKVWPDWAEYIALNEKRQNEWMPRTRGWITAEMDMASPTKEDVDTYIDNLIEEGWLIKL